MLKKPTQRIVTALCTGAALIGLAFYHRYGCPDRVSEVTLYIPAAVYCLSSVVYRLSRCKNWHNKVSNVG